MRSCVKELEVSDTHRHHARATVSVGAATTGWVPNAMPPEIQRGTCLRVFSRVCVASILRPVFAANKSFIRTLSTHPIRAFVLIEFPRSLGGLRSPLWLVSSNFAQQLLDEVQGGVLLVLSVILTIKNKRILQH